MVELADEDKQILCDALRQAGISEQQISLALETNAVLLDQLRCYPLDEHPKRSLLQIFQSHTDSGNSR